MSSDAARVGRPPATVYLLGALGLAVVVLPLVGLVAELPWDSVRDRAGDPRVLTPLRISLLSTAVSTAIVVVVGVPLGSVLAATGTATARVLRGVVALPLVLPPVVAGLALLQAFGANAPLGRALDDLTGWRLPFSFAGVVVAQVFVASPFVALSVERAVRTAGTSGGDAAATMGVGRWRRWRDVTLPAAAPGIAVGTLLAWARAFGEFGATLTFAGSLAGRTETLPEAIYVALDVDAGDAVTAGVLMMVIAIVVPVTGAVVRRGFRAIRGRR